MVIVAVCVILLFSGQCSRAETSALRGASHPLPSDQEAVLLPPPAIDDEFLPCSDCHEDEPTNRTVRVLEDHEDLELSHGDLWCLDCHDADQRGFLHLSDGSLIDMESSWRLCTRCHAEKRADWRAGIHGKRTGHWRGAKEYRTCVVCHSPHSPKFKPLAPKPPPLRASEIRSPATMRWTEVLSDSFE